MVQSGEIVFELTHTHVFDDDREEVKLLGIYSSREKAESAIAKARHLPGFRDSPERLEINEVVVDRVEWPEGS